jgi:hypothetical protein
MKKKSLFILIPLIGYIGLWILGSVLFLVYFEIFNIPMNLEYTVMIQRIPAVLAILTVPLCSSASFFITTKIMLRKFVSLNATEVFQVGIISLLFTIGFDLLITVIIEKVNILVFPVNLMYLFAWLVIVPSVILAGKTRKNNNLDEAQAEH